jgi:hypothetical protein
MFLGLSATFAAPAIEDVVIYECHKAPASPVIDGVLNDTAWKDAVVSEIPYQFMAQVPTPCPVRSTVRLCYDDRALYLASVFDRDSKEPLKQNHQGRDDPDLWNDDCAEIYFDTNVDGKFFKFIVSSAGVVTDFRQTDRGIDYSWNANGLAVRTSVEDERWCIEMSVPWSDLGVATPERAIWGFEILRFSGKRQNWASWTVGAAYARPEKFGLITFGQGFFHELGRLLQAARASKGPRWRLVSRLGILDYSSTPVAVDLAVAEASRKLGEARLNTTNVPDDTKRRKLLEKIDGLQKELDALTGKSLPTEQTSDQDIKSAIYLLSETDRKALGVSYEAMIEEMVSSTK